MKNIEILKLKSGEELIGEVVGDELDPWLEVTNAVVIVVVPGADNRQQLAFIPYVQFSADKTIKLENNHVACRCSPIPQILDEYNRTFSSLTLPSKSIILPQ